MRSNQSSIFVIYLVVLAALAPSPRSVLAQDGSLAADQTSISPDGVIRVQLLPAPPPPPRSPEEMASLLGRVNRAIPIPVSGERSSGPAPGSETTVPLGPAPRTTSPPSVYVVRDTLAGTPVFKSNVTEMSGANNGRFVFATGNWWAARSTNQGVSWSYIDPFSDFADFCCDQDVIYDRSRDLFIWLRQGVPDGSNHNRFKLGVSTDDGASFCTYTVDAPAGEWYDYPHLALTNNNVYITWNMFSTNYLRTRVMSWPLDPMKACISLTFFQFDDTGGTITPAQGGISKAYFGQHRTSALMRIYTWQEGTGSIPFSDIGVPAWTTGGMSCPAPDGGDACARADHRMTSGYVRRHSALAFSQLETVGFFWNAAAGGGFPYPYVENAWFYTNSMAYGGRDLIWNPTYAFLYAAAAPDVRGNLGILVGRAGGGLYPGICVGKDDDTDGLPPGWTVSCPTSMEGNRGPSDDEWGDYNRVRSFMPLQTCWLGTAHMLRDGGTGSFVHPLYVVFGQGRDFDACYLNWRQEP